VTYFNTSQHFNGALAEISDFENVDMISRPYQWNGWQLAFGRGAAIALVNFFQSFTLPWDFFLSHEQIWRHQYIT
jgi:hypothetical protein